MQANSQADLYAVKFADPMIGITVGQAGTILRTADGGKSWEEARVPPTVKSDLFDLAFLAPSRAIAVWTYPVSVDR